MRVQLLLTPFPLDKAELKDKTVVVIDVLRSSTSICAALMAGARGVIPTAKPGESGDLWAKLGSDNAVLAGERQGVKIENFQYGNSPTEFTPETVKGKNVILCTTNGTGIFGLTNGAPRVIACGMVNISAVADAVADAGSNLLIVCAGREGGFSIEDTLCGGMLIHKLVNRHDLELTLNDAASLARLLYNDTAGNLQQAVAQGEHGRFLAEQGMGGDVEICTEVDSMPVLPLMHDGRLTVEEAQP